MAKKTAAWTRKEGKDPKGGLNAKGVKSYRKANPGSKLQTAVTTKPSKLKKGSKSANRRKSFCARMTGMKKKLTSSKTAKDPNSRINKSLRKWNCQSIMSKQNRNYRKEYDNYQSTDKQKKRRASRNAANKLKGKAGMDVDHKDGNPLNNSPSNLVVKSKTANRSFKRTKKATKA